MTPVEGLGFRVDCMVTQRMVSRESTGVSRDVITLNLIKFEP